MAREQIGILISGRGSNMAALIKSAQDGDLNARVAVVISNIESAPGLEKAIELGTDTVFISHKGLNREEHDSKVLNELKKRDISLVCLAGYMRLLSPVFVRAFPNRILNIHPSLLPAFPGLNAQQQALEYGVKVTGCTVHIVDEELDHGPIIVQEPVAVRDDDSVESLSARILEQEHSAYVKAVARVLSDDFTVEGRRCVFRGPAE
jgi:phosphoribosylglycinamide formyltransferase-1